MPISGLAEADGMADGMVFHAGTADGESGPVTAGGRVLGVTALGETVEAAIDRAYKAVSRISWDGVHYRKDIGQKALRRMKVPPRVGIVMGSDSDLPVMEAAASVFKQYEIPFRMTVASAHRSPARAAAFAEGAADAGMKVPSSPAPAMRLTWPGSWPLTPPCR